MKHKIIILVTLCVCWCYVAIGQTVAKPRIYILATGGTIAGHGDKTTGGTKYTPGRVGVATLIEAVPEIQNIADVTGKQFCNIASQDITDDIWIALTKEINALLARDDVDGVVVTHGTDTMEETAYFLNLTVKSDKPVVVVGAMRPPTALSADGQLNLYNAVVVASSKESKGKGVLVVMNGEILGARDAVKTNTTSVETFKSLNSGVLGYVLNSQAVYNAEPLKPHTLGSEFDVANLTTLPKVGIVYGYAGMSADIIRPFLTADYQGIVYAGTGNGNIHRNLFPALQQARSQGVMVVRSSRVSSGVTSLNAEVDDDKYTFVASQNLNPQKARVLLMLALTQTSDYQTIQGYFNRY